MNARHGVFAPTSRLRDKVVPRPASTSDDAEPLAELQVPVAGSVGEVDVGAVDVSPRFGRAAEAGLRRRCPEVFALSGQDKALRSASPRSVSRSFPVDDNALEAAALPAWSTSSRICLSMER
jgi:hypothetical protein